MTDQAMPAMLAGVTLSRRNNLGHNTPDRRHDRKIDNRGLYSCVGYVLAVVSKSCREISLDQAKSSFTSSAKNQDKIEQVASVPPGQG
jgi:hypothetical protein